MPSRLFNWWKHHRLREDFSEWRFLIATPGTNTSFEPGETDTLLLPGPATIMLKCDGNVATASFKIDTGDGDSFSNKAAVSGQAIVIGTFEEGETLTIEHEVTSVFVGEMQLGIRDALGRFRPVFIFTCP